MSGARETLDKEIRSLNPSEMKILALLIHRSYHTIQQWKSNPPSKYPSNIEKAIRKAKDDDFEYTIPESFLRLKQIHDISHYRIVDNTSVLYRVNSSILDILRAIKEGYSKRGRTLLELSTDLGISKHQLRGYFRTGKKGKQKIENTTLISACAIYNKLYKIKPKEPLLEIYEADFHLFKDVMKDIIAYEGFTIRHLSEILEERAGKPKKTTEKYLSRRFTYLPWNLFDKLYHVVESCDINRKQREKEIGKIKTHKKIDERTREVPDELKRLIKKKLEQLDTFPSDILEQIENMVAGNINYFIEGQGVILNCGLVNIELISGNHVPELTQFLFMRSSNYHPRRIMKRIGINSDTYRELMKKFNRLGLINDHTVVDVVRYMLNNIPPELISEELERITRIKYISRDDVIKELAKLIKQDEQTVRKYIVEGSNLDILRCLEFILYNVGETKLEIKKTQEPSTFNVDKNPVEQRRNNVKPGHTKDYIRNIFFLPINNNSGENTKEIFSGSGIPRKRQELWRHVIQNNYLIYPHKIGESAQELGIILNEKEEFKAMKEWFEQKSKK